MCAFFDIYNYSFKWIIYLVVITGVYTFLHWFLAVPLLYFHFYDCCNEKWTENWVVWFLVSSFGCWLGVSLLIFLIWCCLRLLSVKHLNDSNVRLNDKKNGKHPDVMINEKTMAVIEEENLEKREKPEEIVVLPDFNPKGSFTVFQMNDLQREISSSPGANFEIPVEENQIHIQDVETPVKSDKTPREIFFQDLIEGASDSYFDFDPQKISEYVKNKYDKTQVEEKNFFLASKEGNEKMSEVTVALDEKGMLVNEPLEEYNSLKD